MAILLKNGAELSAENILKFNEEAAEPFFIGSALKKNILKAEGGRAEATALRSQVQLLGGAGEGRG